MIGRQFLLVALLLLIGIPLIAQPWHHGSIDLDVGTTALKGRILVKLTAGEFSRTMGRGDFGTAARRFGIYNVTPWITPELLSARGPLYRSNAPTRETPEMALRRIVVVEYSSLDYPTELVKALDGMPGVEYAEVIHPRHLLYSPNDPKISQQWFIDRISARQAWDQVKGDSSMIIGIVDSGVDRYHPDLTNAIWTNIGEKGDGKESNNIDDDNNGFVDDSWGWDFAGSNGSNPDNSPINPFEPHGTLVAGCAAASGDNGIGVVGVAYGCRIMAIKVTEDADSPRLFNESAGVLYAAKMGARVINCSFGGTGRSRAEAEIFSVVINTYGAVVVAACGNDGKDLAIYPASYPDVISVAWTTSQDARADLSNYNYRVDISAPGTDIYSTINGDYFIDSGTSFAAPQVAGAAALVRLRWPALDPVHVGEILRATSDDISVNLSPGDVDKMGTGRLNVAEAVSRGATIRSARMESVRVVEPGGDGTVDPGENIRLELVIRNYLGAADAVTTLVEPVNAAGLVVDRSQVAFGAMGGDERRTTADSAYNISIPANTPENTDIVFSISTITADRINRQYVTLRVAPSYRTTDNNDLAVTFNSSGNVGYNGINRLEGDGFVYRNNKSILYHSGLMIGTDSAHLSDVIRLGSSSMGVADGFRSTGRYRLSYTTDSLLETGIASFSDAHRPVAERVGVDVTMHTYQYRSAAARNLVIVAYTITNRSGAPLIGLRCGLYLDWDISQNGLDDQVGYDPDHLLGFMRDSRTTTGTWSGATLLSGDEIAFHAVDNGLDGPTTSFTPERKWAAFSGGIILNETIDDMGMTLSARGIDLPADSSTVVAFGLMAASSLDSLRAAADEGRRIYQILSSVPYRPIALTNVSAGPNPVTGREATVDINLSRPSRVGVELFSADGRPAAVIPERYLPDGSGSIRLDFGRLPSGVYIYRVTAEGESHYGRIVLLR